MRKPSSLACVLFALGIGLVAALVSGQRNWKAAGRRKWTSVPADYTWAQVSNPHIAQSLVQACGEDARLLCHDDKVDIGYCLARKRGEVTSAECDEWLDARDTCIRAVEALGCQDEVYTCIRMLNHGELGEDCKQTKFYKSALLDVRAANEIHNQHVDPNDGERRGRGRFGGR